MYDGMNDEESTMLETTNLPSRATVVQHNSNKAQLPQSGSVALPAVMHGGNVSTPDGVGNIRDSDFQSSKGLTHSGHQTPTGNIAETDSFSAGQKALYKNLNDSNQRIKVVLEEFGEPTDVPPLGTDLVSMIIYQLHFILCGVKRKKDGRYKKG